MVGSFGSESGDRVATDEGFEYRWECVGSIV